MIWLVLNALALTAALAHFFIDIQIGLFGFTSTEISPLQAANIVATAALFGLWAYALGRGGGGSKTGLITAFIFSIVWAALANGLVALIVAPPPSDGFPYQDIAHILSLILGGAAGYVTWRESKEIPGRAGYALPGAAVLLIVAVLAGQAFIVL